MEQTRRKRIFAGLGGSSLVLFAVFLWNLPDNIDRAKWWYAVLGNTPLPYVLVGLAFLLFAWGVVPERYQGIIRPRSRPDDAPVGSVRSTSPLDRLILPDQAPVPPGPLMRAVEARIQEAIQAGATTFGPRTTDGQTRRQPEPPSLRLEAEPRYPDQIERGMNFWLVVEAKDDALYRAEADRLECRQAVDLPQRWTAAWEGTHSGPEQRIMAGLTARLRLGYSEMTPTSFRIGLRYWDRESGRLRDAHSDTWDRRQDGMAPSYDFKLVLGSDAGHRAVIHFRHDVAGVSTL